MANNFEILIPVSFKLHTGFWNYKGEFMTVNQKDPMLVFLFTALGCIGVFFPYIVKSIYKCVKLLFWVSVYYTCELGM